MNNNFKKGMRFHIEGTMWTFTEKKFDKQRFFADSYSYAGSMEEYDSYIFVSDDGGECSYSGWDAYKMWDYLIYDPSNGWEVGDYFEIKRTGLDPDLRGRLVEIDPQADRWPYKISGPEGSQPIAFGCNELTKIHSVVSYERAPKARAVLVKKIEEARTELEALETALEILDYAS